MQNISADFAIFATDGRGLGAGDPEFDVASCFFRGLNCCISVNFVSNNLKKKKKKKKKKSKKECKMQNTKRSEQYLISFFSPIHVVLYRRHNKNNAFHHPILLKSMEIMLAPNV